MYWSIISCLLLIYLCTTSKKIDIKIAVVSKLKVEFSYSTIQLFNYSGEGRGRSWRVRGVLGGEGDEAGKRRKEQTSMCNPTTPLALKTLKGECVGGGSGKGMKQRRWKKDRRACVIPPPSSPSRSWKVRVIGGRNYTYLSVLSSSSLLHPLNPQPPSPSHRSHILIFQDLPLPSRK